MTKSEIFKMAHKIAKSETWMWPTYSRAFGSALHRIYKRIRAQKFIDEREKRVAEYLEITKRYWDGLATDAEYTQAQIAIDKASQAISNA